MKPKNVTITKKLFLTGGKSWNPVSGLIHAAVYV